MKILILIKMVRLVPFCKKRYVSYHFLRNGTERTFLTVMGTVRTIFSKKVRLVPYHSKLIKRIFLNIFLLILPCRFHATFNSFPCPPPGWMVQFGKNSNGVRAFVWKKSHPDVVTFGKKSPVRGWGVRQVVSPGWGLSDKNLGFGGEKFFSTYQIWLKGVF